MEGVKDNEVLANVYVCLYLWKRVLNIRDRAFLDTDSVDKGINTG